MKTGLSIMALVVIGAFGFYSTGGIAKAEAPAAPAVKTGAATLAAAPSLIGTLGKFATFKEPGTQLDATLSKYCKKTSSLTEHTMTVSEYTCDQKSGLRSASLDARDMGKGQHFVMSLNVNFSPDQYASLKTVLEKNLGKAKKLGADDVEWRTRGGKGIDDYGTPVITLSNNKESKQGEFGLALEQGP